MSTEVIYQTLFGALALVGIAIMDRQERKIKQLEKERDAYYTEWIDEKNKAR